MTCPSQSPRLNRPQYIRWTLQTMKILTVESFTVPILIPNIRLKILFSNTLNLYSSLNVRYDVSHPYWLYYGFIYFNFQIIREKFIRQKGLDSTITWISCYKSTFYSLMIYTYGSIFYSLEKCYTNCTIAWYYSKLGFITQNYQSSWAFVWHSTIFNWWIENEVRNRI